MVDIKDLSKKFNSSGKGLYSIAEKPLVKEIDYRGIFSPGRKEINSNDTKLSIQDKLSVTKNIYRLSDYYWYPENFSSYLISDDIYNSEIIEYWIENAPKAGASQFKMLLREGAETYKKTKGKITDSFGKIKNMVNGVSGDKSVSSENSKFDDMLTKISYIKITEFQPQQEIGSFLNNMKMVMEALDSIISGDKNKGVSKFKLFKQVFSSAGMDEIFDMVVKTNTTESDYIKNIIRIPNFFYENMIGGTYTAQYFVPFFDQRNFINAMGESGWTSRSMKQQFFGNMISGLLDKIPGIGQFDIAGRPKFSLEGNNPLPDPIETVIHLHNYNLDALIANLKFINSITAGAFWIQNKFMQMSSNLYDVEVPGRFRYYLCKGSVKVEWNGKVRTISDEQIGEIQKALPKILNKDSISKFPDMYTVTINFQSLLPNNFNTRLNYIIGLNDVSIAQFKTEKTSKMADAIKTQLEKERTKLKKAAEEHNKTGSED